MKLGPYELNRIYTGDARELAKGIICVDCEHPIDVDVFPDFVNTENAKRCMECTARALWRFMVDDRCEIDDPDALDILANLVALDELVEKDNDIFRSDG